MFWIFSGDHSGLPLAECLQRQGEKVALVLIPPTRVHGKLETPKTPEEARLNRERIKYLNKNGTGLIKKIWVDEAMKVIRPGDEVFFDQIYGWQYGETLRKRGVKVRGGRKIGYTLETERRDTLKLLGKMGFDIPEQKYFGPHSAKKAIEFLKAAKDDPLYVFKSDSPKVLTQVAYDSNEELIQKLTAEGREIDQDGFLLQAKVQGIEFAVETLYCKGKPILGVVDIEGKKKYNEMSEVQTGCSMNICWTIPVNHPLRQRVNGLFDKFAGEQIGTGSLDLSVIYDPKEDKMWALEQCGDRSAYNEFYVLMALCQKPLGEFLSKWIRGEYRGDIYGQVFSKFFGGSVRIFNDNNTPDQRIDYPKELQGNYWLWDCHKKGGALLTTGGECGDSVGIITGVGDNPESALAKVRQNWFHLHLPTKFARDDFDEDDEEGLPLARFHKMKRMKLI